MTSSSSSSAKPFLGKRPYSVFSLHAIGPGIIPPGPVEEKKTTSKMLIFNVNDTVKYFVYQEYNAMNRLISASATTKTCQRSRTMELKISNDELSFRSNLIAGATSCEISLNLEKISQTDYYTFKLSRKDTFHNNSTCVMDCRFNGYLQFMWSRDAKNSFLHFRATGGLDFKTPAPIGSNKYLPLSSIEADLVKTKTFFVSRLNPIDELARILKEDFTVLLKGNDSEEIITNEPVLARDSAPEVFFR